jgi:hypothetical protein
MGKAKSFVPPTIEEVIEYCASRNNMVDPYKFFDFYDVSGWIDSNGKPVKNWKQKVITWEGRGNNGSKPFSANAQRSTETVSKWNIHYDN